MNYDPTNWYWSATDGRIFSSLSNSLVPKNDAKFKELCNFGFQPTAWPRDEDGNQSDEELARVLAPHGIFYSSFPDLQARLKRQIDADAEAERLLYITPGFGQSMTYQQKVAEAQAFKAATHSQASDYPILSSEIGITAETLDKVADMVLAAFSQWQQIGAAIERIRLGAKRDIDAAADGETSLAILAAIVWPSSQDTL
ncbi:hypothetical protein [Ochrobactrum sp. AN78]|uniref:hypothetical protein n=1 Tax=Ochrobactrum sp. AN78 TaxID=3039853 RepID=UPI002989D2A8|nr:hypothetical protein [Ochrobactrum sp. AN78]MDH7791871.1 hypothetical protein [Ochrobactrum sp. AN78]